MEKSGRQKYETRVSYANNQASKKHDKTYFYRLLM
jgi:hypothetical protein